MKDLYKVIENFISSDEAKILADLIIKLEGDGDDQVPLSRSYSNFPACNILLGKMTEKVSAIVGKKLVPTYTYARVYLKGAELKIHKDRPSCEYSVTVNLAQTHPWPIYMGTTKVNQNPGDGVVYKGCEIDHWREAFEGDEYTQVFLHYVDVNGPHKDHQYDVPLMKEANKPQYRFVFQDLFHNHTEYYRFIKGVPDYFVNYLRKALDEKVLVDAKVGSGEDGVVAKDTRRSKVYWLPKTDEFVDIYKMLFDFLAKCNNEFYQFKLSEITEHIQYTVYSSEDQGFYDWHIDMGPNKARRKLSLVCQLSDPSEYEGGELQINAGRVLAPEKEKGTVIIFPSYLLHRVTPVTKGVRRSLVLWIEGPAFT